MLQADSDNNSATDLSLQPPSAHTLHPSSAALTPSSRGKHMLMVQHQQRSSIDTEVLEEDPEPAQVRSRVDYSEQQRRICMAMAGNDCRDPSLLLEVVGVESPRTVGQKTRVGG